MAQAFRASVVERYSAYGFQTLARDSCIFRLFDFVRILQRFTFLHAFPCLRLQIPRTITVCLGLLMFMQRQKTVIFNLSESVVTGARELPSQSQLLSLLRTQDSIFCIRMIIENFKLNLKKIRT